MVAVLPVPLTATSAATPSGPPLVSAYPSAVHQVFSKEEGKSGTRLQWRADPDEGVSDR
jgi:hypothetical protein